MDIPKFKAELARLEAKMAVLAAQVKAFEAKAAKR